MGWDIVKQLKIHAKNFVKIVNVINNIIANLKNIIHMNDCAKATEATFNEDDFVKLNYSSININTIK